MVESEYGVKPGEHIPGKVLHRYLTDFARKFGVLERLKFNTRVEALEPDSTGGWVLTAVTEGSTPVLISSRKIIVATGLTSTPNMPKLEGSSFFNAPIFHAKDFCRLADTMTGTKNVTVFGGAKSAYDVAYAYVQAGTKVDLVIRPSGNGPVWLSHPWVMGGKKRLEKLLHTRWMTWFSPCPWESEDGFGWVKRLMHGTAVGRFIVSKFWAGIYDDVVQLTGVNSHPETKKLLPWNPLFYIGSGLSIHNYDSNFFDLVKSGMIRVHIAEIDRLSDHTVHLSTGEILPSDSLICSTGWRKEPSIDLTAIGPHGIGFSQSADQQERFRTEADLEILRRFPRLEDQPALNFKPKNDPFRLYRFIVPPTRINDRNIAFSGLVSSVSTACTAYAQALWISAFLDGRLDRLAKTDDEVIREVMLHTQWGRWRYPTGYGASLPDFAFDSIPYVDMLVNDLGLSARRKSSLFKELTEPYEPRDYAKLVDEWAAKHANPA